MLHQTTANVLQHLNHEYVATEPIKVTFNPGHLFPSRKPSNQQCHVITAFAACIAIEPSLPNCARQQLNW